MMKCKDIQDMLFEYIDNTLPDELIKTIGTHLNECEQCRTALDEYKEIRDNLVHLESNLDFKDVKEKTMKKINALNTSSGERFWLRPVKIGIPVIVALAVILTLYLMNAFSGIPGALNKAYAAMEKLSSYRMTDDEYLQITRDGELVYTWHSEFSYSHPGNYYLKKGYTEESLIDSTYSHEAIYTDNQLYILGDSSYQLKPESIEEGIPSSKNTDEVLDLLTKIETLQEGIIDGIECYHYKGTVDIEKWLEWGRLERRGRIERSVAEKGWLDIDIEEWLKTEEEMWRTKQMTYEFWIGKEDYLIRQWEHTVSTLPGKPLLGGSYKWYVVLHYYDFNEPVTIEAPIDEYGNLLDGWTLTTLEE